MKTPSSFSGELVFNEHGLTTLDNNAAKLRACHNRRRCIRNASLRTLADPNLSQAVRDEGIRALWNELLAVQKEITALSKMGS